MAESGGQGTTAKTGKQVTYLLDTGSWKTEVR